MVYTTIQRSIIGQVQFSWLRATGSTRSAWFEKPLKIEAIVSSQKPHLIVHTSTHGFVIPQVSHTKYLGIVIDENLKWTQHVNMISAKANSVQNLLQRNLVKCPPIIKSHCYNTFVRPILEYVYMLVLSGLHIMNKTFTN